MPDTYDDNDVFEEDYDPLAVDDEDIDQENMDDDNPLDTVDYPTMRNMPESMHRDGVFTPETQGDAKTAILSLVEHNPARKKVLLAIIDTCRDGAPASVVEERVNAVQKDNESVYEPMTLCRILERAGGLTLEMPETSDTKEDQEKNVEYLEIKEKVDPVWHATQGALDAYDELTDGSEFRKIVLEHDVKYLDVYTAVMELASAEEGCSMKQINEKVDSFEIVREPRRFGTHFIELLERTDAVEWKDRAWHITDFGRTMLQQIKDGKGNADE